MAEEITCTCGVRINALALSAQIDTLTRERDEAREALRAVEWRSRTNPFQDGYCILCERFENEGHKADCLVGKALAATEPK